MTKRSKRVAIAIVGAASFALAGCQDETVDAAAYPDLQSCLDDAALGSIFQAQQCREAFAEAEALHVEAAPRYDSLAVCEEQLARAPAALRSRRLRAADRAASSCRCWPVT